MNMLNAILGEGEGGGVGALAQQLGLCNEEVSWALSALLRALGGGL